MKFGAFEIQAFLFGTFRLDGGAMFGSVPKNLWSKRLAPDAENCIPLAARSLLITYQDRKILIDVGLGEKWRDKDRAIFAIENTALERLPFKADEITDVVLTHLHFDHAGGISAWDSNKIAKLAYPNAKVWLQRANLENARLPNPRERASYLAENVQVLDQAHLQLVDGDAELLPGFWVHRVDGHTVGQQWIELREGDRSVVFPTDLFPTTHHLPVPFAMGYDIHVAKVLDEKKAFLNYISTRDAIIVFEHDPTVAAARVSPGINGHFVVSEDVSALFAI